MASKTKKNLPGVGQLISDSWRGSTERWGTILILFVIEMLVMVALAIVAAIVGIGGGLGLGLIGKDMQSMTTAANWLPVIMKGGSVMIAALVIAGVAAAILGSIFQGAMIAAAAADKKIGVGEAIAVGKAKAVKFLLTGILASGVILGGWFLFLIPGLIISILFSFVMFVVVLDNRSGLDALRASGGMVKEYFWEILGRFTVLFGINFAISIALGIVTGILSGMIGKEQAAGLNSLFSMVLTLGETVFNMLFLAVLYKQLRAANGIHLMRLRTIGIAGIIGLFLFGLVMYGTVRLLTATVGDPIGTKDEGVWPYVGPQGMGSNADPTDFSNMTEADWQKLLDDAAKETPNASGKPAPAVKIPVAPKKLPAGY